MPLDDFLPKYDFYERHQTLVRAPVETTRRAIDEWKIEPASPMRVLFLLRGLGMRRKAIRFRDSLKANGFLLLAEDDHEIAYGQIGRFWALRERAALVSPKTTEEFLTFSDPRFAVAVMDVRVEAVRPGRTRLTTETRIRCLGRRSRTLFRMYWFFIRPFSGLIRRWALRGIKEQAERSAGASLLG